MIYKGKKVIEVADGKELFPCSNCVFKTEVCTKFLEIHKLPDCIKNKSHFEFDEGPDNEFMPDETDEPVMFNTDEL